MKLENITCEADLGKTQKGEYDFVYRVDNAGIVLSEGRELTDSEITQLYGLARISFGYSFLKNKKEDKMPGVMLEQMDKSDFKSYVLDHYVKGYKIREKIKND